MGLNLTYAYGQTPLTAEELDDLIIKSISTRGELDEFELHRRMLGDVWSWAGQTRRSNKNIGVDWRDIPMHLRYLVDDAKYWVVNKTFSNVHIAI